MTQEDILFSQGTSYAKEFNLALPKEDEEESVDAEDGTPKKPLHKGDEELGEEDSLEEEPLVIGDEDDNEE